MALQPGTRVGPYEITGQIGAGGMGEVYRAVDTNLGRHVAIKVLPDIFANDPDRLARFEREAKTLASLNHSNIAQIYGIEKGPAAFGGAQAKEAGHYVRALVMELVEGPTLADRIAQGAIPVDEALPIARQIAEALEAAHEQGIIHRDLKPANIKVRPDGTVKVLDFGLAKALEPISARAIDATASPTITSPAMMTGVGMLLGTAAYMSPEQARGKAVDKRSDIWAFGAVLFEMLSGRRAFQGEDVSETLAKVIEREPPWDALPTRVPPAVRRLLARCLEKNPRRRLRDIGDGLLELDPAAQSLSVDPLVAAGHAPRALWRRALPAALAASFASVVVGLAVWTLARPPAQPPRAIVRFEVNTPAEGPLVMTAAMRDVAMSPDGKHIVYESSTGGATARRLYARHLDQTEATMLRGTEQAQSPFFSPDGQWVGFVVTNQRTLRKVPVLGGPAVTIADLPDDIPRGLSWGVDDHIVFASATSKGLRRVPALGGQPEVLTTVSPEDGTETDHWWPEILPNGKGVLFTAWSGSEDSSRIAVVSLEDRKITYLVSGGSHPQYSPTGHIVYGVDGTLRAVGFDQDRLALTTTNPVAVLENVNTKRNAGAANFTLASNGSLVYVTGTDLGPRRTLVWVDRDGREEPLRLPAVTYGWARVSPDGSRVAVSVTDSEGDQDVWISELARGTLSRVTTDPQLDNDPVWTRDSRRIVFASRRQAARFGFYLATADGTGSADLLLMSETPGFFRAYDWSRDGDRLVFDYGTANGRGNIGILSIKDALVWKPLLQTEASEVSPALSPDGAWLAYASDQSGRFEVYVERFPDLGDRRQISTDGGAAPRWAPNGRELFYLRGDAMMVVSINGDAGLSVGNPSVLFEGPYFSQQQDGSRRYDIDPAGKRFLMIKEGSEDASPQKLMVVENWLEELKRLVPAN